MGIICKLRGCVFVANGCGGDESGECCRLERCARCGRLRKVRLGTNHRFAVSRASCRRYEWEGCEVSEVCEFCGYERTNICAHDDRVTAYVAQATSPYLLGITKFPNSGGDSSCAGTVECRLCGRVKEDASVHAHEFVALPPTTGPARLPAVGTLSGFDTSISAQCVDGVDVCKYCGTLRVMAHHAFEDLGRRDIKEAGTVEQWTDYFRCRVCAYEYGESDYRFTDLMG